MSDKKTTLQPPLDKILVRIDDEKALTESGILIPENQREKPAIGEIIAVGPGKQDEPMMYSVGDRIMWISAAGIQIQLNGVDHAIIHQRDTHGRIANNLIK